jgi:hypothetical protein
MWADAVRGWVVHSGRTLFRAAAVTEAGGFAPGLVVAEDRDLWLRVSRSGDATFIPDVVLEHRMHPAQWRPVGVESIEIEVTRRHLGQLSARERRIGERIIATRPYYQEARTAWAEGHAIGALRAYMRLARMPPKALFSPLFRPEWTSFFRRSLLGALIGKRNVDRVRRLLSARRETGGAVEEWDPPFPKETGRPGSTHTISSE